MSQMKIESMKEHHKWELEILRKRKKTVRDWNKIKNHFTKEKSYIRRNTRVNKQQLSEDKRKWLRRNF